MLIVVPSVHHTGTKTVFLDILKDLQPEVNQQDYKRNEGKLRIHIDKPFLDDLHFWCARCPAIVPLRHPRKVAYGWKARAKPLWDLTEQWNWLKEEIDPYVPYYLPLDSPERGHWLQEINRSLGTSFTTDWPMLGHSEATTELDDKDEFLIQSWMEDGFFEQFGYS